MPGSLLSSGRMRSWPIAAVVLGLVAVLAVPADAAKRKKKGPRPTPAPRPLYGPPAPTPPPILRAAGACLGYEPGQFLLLSEVGEQGRMFRIGPDTVLRVQPRRGARIRLLYVETPEGPLAREVLPGPSSQ